MQKYAFYVQKYMQKYVKLRTVLANHAKICKKYARNMQEICNEIMQKYAKIYAET